jgi:hypothetical protein
MTPTPFVKKMYFGYLLVLLILGLLISSFLSKNTFKIIDKRSSPSNDRSKEVSVTLQVELPKQYKKYQEKMTTNNTVLELMEKIRDENPDFNFEITRHDYGISIDQVNGQALGSAKKWALLQNLVDITANIEGLKLTDTSSYTLTSLLLP